MDYKKILEGIVNIISTTEKSDIGFANICTYIGENCPELKESEDEQSKKWILEYLYDGLRKSNEQFKGQFNAAIAWLEKQGEQKPAWGEEDENRINRLIAYFEDKESFTAEDDVVYANWLKSLKDRVQPKQEWSEEDEKMLNQIIKDYERGNESWLKGQGSLPFGNRITWLKSLSPQSHWKPSDELDEASYQVGVKRVLENPESYGLTKNNWKPSEGQMEALKEACDEHWEADGLDPLYTLYQDLMKLREE